MREINIKKEITEIEVDFWSVYSQIKLFPVTGRWLSVYNSHRNKILDENKKISAKLDNLKGNQNTIISYTVNSMIKCQYFINFHIACAHEGNADVRTRNKEMMIVYSDEFIHLISVVKSSSDKFATDIASISEKLESIIRYITRRKKNMKHNNI